MNEHMGIMVSELIFGLHPEYVTRVGADCSTTDGSQASVLAERMSARLKKGCRAYPDLTIRKSRMQEAARQANTRRFETPEQFFRGLDADVAGGAGFAVSVSLFRQENATHFMLRLSPAQPGSTEPAVTGQQMLLQVIASAPDAFVVTDLDSRILTVNHGFLDLVQLANEEVVRNESLEKWLGRSGVELNVLISNLRQSGTVRLFATTMRGKYGSTAEVEISAVAVAVPSGEQTCLGFTIRDVGRCLTSDTSASRELPRSASQMTELVGRVPLHDIVRETTDLIEQLCIEAALELTSDNRACAAEMLGLSRQSPYVKLRRFGNGDTLPKSDR